MENDGKFYLKKEVTEELFNKIAKKYDCHVEYDFENNDPSIGLFIESDIITSIRSNVSRMGVVSFGASVEYGKIMLGFGESFSTKETKKMLKYIDKKLYKLFNKEGM